MTRIRFEDLPSTNTPRNAENLNKLNNVVISSSEPNTGEEVWIQKGKNLYNPSNAYVTGASGQNISIIIDVLPNTTYTFSIGSYTWGEAKEYDASGTLLNSYGGTETSKIITFTTASTTKYVELPFYSGVSNIDINAIDFTQIQFEQGSNATDYEAYVDKKIYIKNSGGTYDEFLNVENANNQQNYSTNEQVIGTFLDKPLYRKVIYGTSSTVDTNFDINHNILNIDKIMLGSNSHIEIEGNSFPPNMTSQYTDTLGKRITITTVNKYTVNLYVGSYLQSTGYSYYFVLEYTKTTD